MHAAALVMVLATGLSAGAPRQDARGGKDHPLISRMPDFFIYQYKEAQFATEKFTGEDKKPVSIEGHSYSIKYFLQPDAGVPGALGIKRNVMHALSQIGGVVTYDRGAEAQIVVKRGDGETWVRVKAYDKEYTLTIVERQTLVQSVIANADALATGLETSGHVTVNGILFDTGKSEIKPESAAAIAEVAKLLEARADLKVSIVGHTDNVGVATANLKLAQERAAAVMAALTTTHGIAASRLSAFGVGPYAPVASNASEDGRSRNRRVEIVEQ